MKMNNGHHTFDLLCPLCQVVFAIKASEVGEGEIICIYCGTPLVWNDYPR